MRLLTVPDRSMQATVIDARFDAMLAAGALEEVRALLAQAFPASSRSCAPSGVAPLAGSFGGRDVAGGGGGEPPRPRRGSTPSGS